MNRLFVYGIFLDAQNREDFGMTNPMYRTVKNYATLGNEIVSAVFVDNANVALTGLLVDVDPRMWPDIDALESGYDRITVTTTSGEEAYMYAGRTR